MSLPIAKIPGLEARLRALEAAGTSGFTATSGFTLPGGSAPRSLNTRFSEIRNVQDYGATGDGVILTTANMTAASGVLTDANAGFQAADVGKKIAVFGAGAHRTGTDLTDLVIDGTTNTIITSAARPFVAAHVGGRLYITSGTGWTVQAVTILSVDVATGKATCSTAMGTLGSTGGNGAIGTDSLFTTIASRQSNTQVTLTDAASTTIANTRAMYGTDDTGAIRSAVASNTTLYFPSGNYYVTKYSGANSSCIFLDNFTNIQIVGEGNARIIGGWDSSVQSHCYAFEGIGASHISFSYLQFDIIAGGQPNARQNQACIFMTDAGALTADCGWITIDHCTFTIQASLGSSASSASGTAIFGIYISSAGNDDTTYPVNMKHVRVTNNTFLNCDGRQAEGQAVWDYLCANNQVIGEGPNGLALGFRFINSSRGVRVIGNYIEDAVSGANGGSHYGIVFQAGTIGADAGRRGVGNMAANNHISFHGSDVNNQSAGIYIERQDNPQIFGNVLEYTSLVANAGYGIRFSAVSLPANTDGTAGARVANNRINGWNGFGIYNVDTFASNILEWDNSFGVKSVDGVTVLGVNDSSHIIKSGTILTEDVEFFPAGANEVFTVNYPSDASATWDFDPTGLSTAGCQMRLFRLTNTSGYTALEVLKANNSATANHALAANSNSYLCADNGNLALFGTGSFNGTKVLFINNCTAAPNGNPTGGGLLYVEAGALKYRGSSGTVTTIGPA